MELSTNQKYKKALHYYDLGDYDKSEKFIKDVLKESKDIDMLIQVHNCFAEILLDQERYNDAKKSVDFVLDKTKGNPKYEEEREMAEEFKYIIENEM